MLLLSSLRSNKLVKEVQLCPGLPPRPGGVEDVEDCCFTMYEGATTGPSFRLFNKNKI